MLSVSPYCIVIFEVKGNMCTVIAAFLISPNPPFIPGIWSLAPTSTMIRLRLQKWATKSSCPTGVRPRLAPGEQEIPGHFAKLEAYSTGTV